METTSMICGQGYSQIKNMMSIQWSILLKVMKNTMGESKSQNRHAVNIIHSFLIIFCMQCRFKRCRILIRWSPWLFWPLVERTLHVWKGLTLALEIAFFYVWWTSGGTVTLHSFFLKSCPYLSDISISTGFWWSFDITASLKQKTFWQPHIWDWVILGGENLKHSAITE